MSGYQRLGLREGTIGMVKCESSFITVYVCQNSEKWAPEKWTSKILLYVIVSINPRKKFR